MRNKAPMVCIKCNLSIKSKTANGRRLCDFHIKEEGKRIREKYKIRIKETLEIWRNKNRKYIKNHNKKLVDSGYFNKWNKEHQESIFNTGKKHREIHKKEINIKNKRRQEKLKSLPGSHTDKEWKEVCKKWGNTCCICRKKKKLTKDHIIPIWENNSTNDIINIRPLCGSCNSKEGAKYQHSIKVD
jgi:hypothetical protein